MLREVRTSRFDALSRLYLEKNKNKGRSKEIGNMGVGRGGERDKMRLERQGR